MVPAFLWVGGISRGVLFPGRFTGRITSRGPGRVRVTRPEPTRPTRFETILTRLDRVRDDFDHLLTRPDPTRPKTESFFQPPDKTDTRTRSRPATKALASPLPSLGLRSRPWGQNCRN